MNDDKVIKKVVKVLSNFEKQLSAEGSNISKEKIESYLKVRNHLLTSGHFFNKSFEMPPIPSVQNDESFVEYLFVVRNLCKEIDLKLEKLQ